MSKAVKAQMSLARFSLKNLMILTALISLITAVGLTLLANRRLIQKHADLLTLSSQLQINDHGRLQLAEMPRIADDCYSWNVHVPHDHNYELRLGIGEISENGVPPIVDAVPLSQGEHRVTLISEDSPEEEFRFAVFVDGEKVIDRAMGAEWLAGGWSMSSGMSWPSDLSRPTTLQLSAKSYQPNHEFGSTHYFNGQSDDLVTKKGYRLWIDAASHEYQPVTSFVSFRNNFGHYGVGLRDGLRWKPLSRPPYDWIIARPKLLTTDPVIRISAEFVGKEGKRLNSQTASFQSWQLYEDATGKTSLNWPSDSEPTIRSAFLRPKMAAETGLQPVVELMWDLSRPDEVGLRIADTPENEVLDRWRLSILDGSHHLLRKLEANGQPIVASDAVNLEGAVREGGRKETSLSLQDGDGNYRLEWQTNESLPLQIVERSQRQYARMGLYGGLPVKFGMQIPTLLDPKVTVSVVTEIPDIPGTPFPGGAVFEEINIDLDATQHDWIWLRAVAN